MRTKRFLRQMAGQVPSPYDRALKRHTRNLVRARRNLVTELLLIDAISRRQAGEEGAPPMPYQKMRADLEKMAKGELP